jgi:hypothetical protein
MATLLPKNLIPAFESTLQRATIDGLRVHTASGRVETGTAQFSHESILRYLDTAAVLVAARVEANAVRTLFETRSGPAFQVGRMLRLRGTTPNVNGNTARRRTRTSDAYYSDRGGDPTDSDPAYIFEGGEVRIRGNSVNPVGSEIGVVKTPLTRTSTASGITLSGTDLQTSALDDKHEQTILYLDDGSTVYSARATGVGNPATVDTTAPDGTYDVTYFDHACTELGTRHKAAVVEFAAAQAFASLGESDALEASLSNFGNQISSDVMVAFDLRDNDS